MKVINRHGDNDYYYILHLGKAVLERQEGILVPEERLEANEETIEPILIRRKATKIRV